MADYYHSTGDKVTITYRNAVDSDSVFSTYELNYPKSMYEDSLPHNNLDWTLHMLIKHCRMACLKFGDIAEDDNYCPLVLTKTSDESCLACIPFWEAKAFTIRRDPQPSDEYELICMDSSDIKGVNFPGKFRWPLTTVQSSRGVLISNLTVTEDHLSSSSGGYGFMEGDKFLTRFEPPTPQDYFIRPINILLNQIDNLANAGFDKVSMDNMCIINMLNKMDNESTINMSISIGERLYTYPRHIHQKLGSNLQRIKRAFLDIKSNVRNCDLIKK